MSDQYIVSARKYRPQTFDTVVGQEHITTTLKNAIKHNHLAHAYLFCGPRGVGKTTCARILAKTINCENPTSDTEACGVCSTCQSFNNNTSFNVFELDAASNNSVDDIRNLTDQVRFAPQAGKYKIYIIDEVHMLSASAFNAFLKTLEEPPPYAIFILATTEKHKILPTILSRCQIFDFKRITTHDIVAHLQGIAAKESIIAQEAALHVIAQKSEGCMRDALSMLDRIVSFTNGMLTYQSTMEHLNLLDADYYFKLTDHILSADVSSTLLQLDDALERGFEGDVIIEGMAEHLRNLLLCKDARMAKLLDVPNDHKPMYHEKANQTPPSFIISGLNVVNESELNYKNATNKRLHVEMCLIRLCYLLQATSANADDVKKNFDGVDTLIPPSQPIPAAHHKVIELVPPLIDTLPASIVEEPEIKIVKKSAPEKQEVPAKQEAKPVLPSFSQPSVGSGTGGKRLSNILKNLDADIDSSMKQAVEQKKELTAELIEELWQQYKASIPDSRSVLKAQLKGMFAEFYAPDEIRVVCRDSFTVSSANNERDKMIEFFMKQSGSRIRVKVEQREDPNAVNDQPTVLSRQDIYNEMAKKNPHLDKLREALNLQMDF
jgi:DNA polymerase-3 subunit gamma/tau